MHRKNFTKLVKKTNQIKTFGNSMVPLLYNGDVVNLQKTSFSKLRVNDIVCFKQKTRFISHRIIYKKQKYLITKGDHNFKDDGKIYSKDIIGKVVSVKRGNEIIDPETIYLVQSTIYLNEIKSITKILTSKKIDFVFLKGLPIHLFYEKIHPRRLYVDCDILVDKDQYKKAVRTLSSLGYKPLISEAKSSIIKGRYSVEESYFKMVNGFKVVLDLHNEPAFLMTQLGNLNPIYPQELIKNLGKKLLDEKQTPEINDAKIPILSRENMLLYLALHLFHHNFKSYYRYELMDNLIRKKNFDFKKVAQIANDFKLSNFIYPVFLLLKKYYQTPLPQNFIKSIKTEKINEVKLKKIMKTRIFEEETRLDAGVERFTLIYDLSPEPFYKKNLVFANPEVIQSVAKVLKARIFNLTKRSIDSLTTQ